ncbi:MAG: hypothetical protein ACXWW0_09505 [Bacteroidia bacterium]
MYKEHPVFNDPDEGLVKIWRYFDFTKFVSLIQKKALFFSRADKFKDPFEGSWTHADAEKRQDLRVEELRKKNPIISDDDIAKALRNDSAFYKNIKKTTLINSWHYNESESAAMWKLFLKSNEGIAIQTTTSLFKESFKHFPQPVYIGKVNYIDYEDDKFYYPFNDTYVAFLHKRRAFEHEREYRAILSLDPNFVWDEQENPFGQYIPIDVDVMIEKVFVSPGTPSWYTELIVSMCEKYGLHKEVVPSGLNKKPIF